MPRSTRRCSSSLAMPISYSVMYTGLPSDASLSMYPFTVLVLSLYASWACAPSASTGAPALITALAIRMKVWCSLSYSMLL